MPLLKVKKVRKELLKYFKRKFVSRDLDVKSLFVWDKS
jgi:hypothetical protein